ncbi:sugar phosphate isomerase [Tothia fuscella]|uniref:Sugar phosphate isomerase n=1 Tax=Tothia fuscella TaxID=1048955 RepID=A0A9P4TZD5_9PEZI|nr:sugar phosphate isomerase [Tothia fuscella]
MPHRPAIASMSLGQACVHNLSQKLDQAQKYGFKGIELFYEDLETYAIINEGGNAPQDLIEAARSIRQLCDNREITIIGLQPFMHYEGLWDRDEHARRIEQLKLWFHLAKILGTNLIQIASGFLGESELNGDLNVIVNDLREAAELGMMEEPAINLSYESLAWGTYSDTWEHSWTIVEQVGMPNFGICLDTFNIAARVYADPTTRTGRTPNAEADIKASIKRLVQTVDVSKIFFVQLVDAERLSIPLIQGHEFFVEGQPARMSWSRNCRLFYGEQEFGAYLPIRDIAHAILKELGYQGWVSAELFNRLMSSPDQNVPEQLARRGALSWKKLVNDLDLQVV